MDDWEDLEPDTFASTPEDDHVEAPSPPKQEPAETTPSPDVDEPICRICFSGADEEDLGKLITPCLCKGSVAKVHVACLNRWRNTSRSSKSFFECDQCHYRYRIKRARIAGLAENRYALASLTISFFVVLVFLNGFIGNWLLKQGNSDSFVSTMFFSGPPNPYSTWPYRESYLPLDAVGQAVEYANKVAQDLARTEPKSSRFKRKVIEDNASSGSSYRIVRERVRPRKSVVKAIKQTLSHFVLGISMTGIGSFLWLLLTLPLWPLHPLRNGLFRSMRAGRDSRGNPSPLGTAVLVLFVVVGLVKSLHLCYKLTRKTAHVILTRAESGILEVR